MQWLTFGWLSLEWINTLIFFDLILDARYPNTNSIESMTLDLPLPFGPTIAEKFYNNNDIAISHCAHVHVHTNTHTHTHTTVYSSLDFVRDNPVSGYQKKHLPTHI